jgi:hypothetical protein
MLITIARFSYVHEAHLAKLKLDAVDIPAYVADANLISMNWFFSNAVGGVKLQVPAEFDARARQILEQDFSADVQAEDPSTQDCCSACGSTNFQTFRSGEPLAAVSILLAGFPLWFSRSGYRCESCGLTAKK